MASLVLWSTDAALPSPLPAPDIAVEVLSRSESASELQEKLDDYHVSGTALIWVVDPIRRTVMSMAADSAAVVLHESDTLTGGRVLPNFSCCVAQIFEGIARDPEVDEMPAPPNTGIRH